VKEHGLPPPRQRKPARRGRMLARAVWLLPLGLGPACVIPLSSPVGTGDAGAPNASATNGNDSGADGASGPSGMWINATANLANMPSQCGNLVSVFAKPDEDLVIAGIALDGLWASRDGGAWAPIGTAADAGIITSRPSSAAFDPQVSTRYWISGFDNGLGVYETTDDGDSFAALGDVNQIDLVSVDFTDPARQTLLAGVHETSQGLWRSTDGGMTWTNVGGALPANTACSFPVVIDSQTHLVGCDGYGGGPAGVYRTTDGANTWTAVSTSGGFHAPLVASDGSIYWASGNGAGMIRSTNNGQTWTTVVGPDIVASLPPTELPDGRIATVGGALYATQYVLVSKDHGATWTQVSPGLPYTTSGIVYSGARRAFYIWTFTCSGASPVPPNAIMRYDFDYTTQ
jgi:photosystem II stability/assembly factor-like uncharacterized protein